MDLEWWQKSVVYQIYPRSFYDSNNDGVGDIRGIIEKLEYLEFLGVNILWLCPIYESPNVDNGYDISNYFEVSKEYGTLDDIKELIEKAASKNIKVMMDIVANHSSDCHKWFINASQSVDSEFHDFYVWRDGDVNNPPNELKANFGGSAWTYHEKIGKYYLHLFAEQQPDLNWHNEKVREAFGEIINWWMDQGIMGFRFDVIDLIAKDPDKMIMENGDNLHAYIKELNTKSFGKKSIATVGETWGVTPEIGIQYTNPKNNELSMIFQFEHIMLDQVINGEKWDLKELSLLDLKIVMSKWQTKLHNKGWNSLFWNNHDLPRIVSRWGNDKEYRVESAKMLAILLHFMQGTPYIYQGEEIGMTNIKLESIDEMKDIEAINMYYERLEQGYDEKDIRHAIDIKGRDNARTPMQWTDSAQAGFTKAQSWMKVNRNYKDINVENSLEDSESIFYCYQKLIALRRDSIYADLIAKGSYQLIMEKDPNIFAYERSYEEQHLCVYCNFYAENIVLDMGDLLLTGKVILGNYNSLMMDENQIQLRPYEAFVIVR